MLFRTLSRSLTFALRSFLRRHGLLAFARSRAHIFIIRAFAGFALLLRGFEKCVYLDGRAGERRKCAVCCIFVLAFFFFFFAVPLYLPPKQAGRGVLLMPPFRVENRVRFALPSFACDGVVFLCVPAQRGTQCTPRCVFPCHADGSGHTNTHTYRNTTHGRLA